MALCSASRSIASRFCAAVVAASAGAGLSGDAAGVFVGAGGGFCPQVLRETNSKASRVLFTV
jgi:hypothetical protein